MEDKKKVIIVSIVAVIAVGFAVYMASRTVSGPKEEIVGTINFGAQGGKASEVGKGAGPNTTPETPKDINANPAGMD